MNIDDGVDAHIDFEARDVWFFGPLDLPDHTIEHYFLDLVYPRLLAREGSLVIHSGAVQSPAGAICVTGPSGFGKSTLTGSLHRAGMPIISDDAIILRSGHAACTAEGLYPGLRLFPDSLAAIIPDAGLTSVMAHYSDKRRIPVAEGPASSPVAAIFRLFESDEGEGVWLERLDPAVACIALVENSFAFDPEDRVEGVKRFGKAADVARIVPVFDLAYPRDYAALPDVHAAIFAAIGLRWPLIRSDLA